MDASKTAFIVAAVIMAAGLLTTPFITVLRKEEEGATAKQPAAAGLDELEPAARYAGERNAGKERMQYEDSVSQRPIRAHDKRGRHVRALLVADDGTIAFTGSLVEARERAEDASEIDLAGKTVLPGFIDGHSHFTGTTQYLLNPDLSACRSFADIQNVLRDFIQKRGIDENGVVMAIGYDQNALAERRHPTKDVLDEVSRDIPIVVMQASNHMGVANSKALELTGITQKRLIRKAACTDAWKARMSQRYAEEPGALFPLYGMVQPRMNIDVPSMLDEMMSFYLEHGVTTCQEGAAQPDFTDMFAKIARDGKLKLDIVSYPMYDHDVDGQLERCAEFDGPDYIGHYRIGGLKMFLDGSPQGRTAWMTEPTSPARTAPPATAATAP